LAIVFLLGASANCGEDGWGGRRHCSSSGRLLLGRVWGVGEGGGGGHIGDIERDDTHLATCISSWLIKIVMVYTIWLQRASLGFRASLAKARPSAIRLSRA
jgi:hypothetical protein